MTTGRLNSGIPSETALRMAVVRAAHQIYDQPTVLFDPLAMRIIGPHGRARVLNPRAGHLSPTRRRPRAAAIARSRFSEDAMLAAAGRGIDQMIILGAGLDTFAYRTPIRHTVKIVEVDHPATQDWKRMLLNDAGIPIPKSVTFAGADLAKVPLTDALADAGVNLDRPLFVSWLGVVYYVPLEGVETTLQSIGSLAKGSELVFDYLVSPNALTGADREELLYGLDSVAAIGEPWVTFFDPEMLGQKLHHAGFAEVEYLDSMTLANRFGLSHQYRPNIVVHATVR